MLDGYSMLGWIIHSDILSSLVISVLKKEVFLVSKAKKAKGLVGEQVTKNKNTI